MIPYIPLIVCVAGLILFLITTAPKVEKIAWRAFVLGLIFVLLQCVWGTLPLGK